MAVNLKDASSLLSLTADAVTPPFETRGLEVVSIQATWTGLNAADSQMVIEASNNITDWNILDADKNQILLDTAADSQIWNVVQLQNNYVRLRFTANSNSAGTSIVTFDGRGN